MGLVFEYMRERGMKRKNNNKKTNIEIKLIITTKREIYYRERWKKKHIEGEMRITYIIKNKMEMNITREIEEELWEEERLCKDRR